MPSAMTSAQPAPTDCHLDLQVEQLLETYYIDVCKTHNKLLALSESTADTASFVYFDLTINRNSLIMVRARPIVAAWSAPHSHAES